MSSVLGIDLSTFAIEMVRLDENSNAAAWDHLQLEGPDALERLRDVPRRMPRWGSTFYDDVYLIAVENPMGRGEAGTQAKLNQVVGAVIACLPPGMPVWDVRPHQWRHELELPGNARKDVCAARVIEMGARPDWADQNAYDAWAVAYYAREVNQRGREAA